jgi:hypothetical protein
MLVPVLARRLNAKPVVLKMQTKRERWTVFMEGGRWSIRVKEEEEAEEEEVRHTPRVFEEDTAL